MSTELIVSQSSQSGIYQQMAGLTTLVDTMGTIFFQTGAGGVQSAAEGKLLALTCVSENKPWTEITRVNHMIKGRLTKKADVMLGEFCLEGGVHEWISQGQDGKAVLKLTHKGKTIESTYSIEDAKRAGIDITKGNWAARPASMLRARATSEGVRMIAPWIVSGIYTPEEINDSTEEAVSSTKGRSKKEAKTAEPGEVIDADYVVVPTSSASESSATTTQPASASSPSTAVPAQAEEPPFETKSEVAPATTAQAPVPQTGTATTPPADDLTMLLVDIGMTAVQAGFGAKSADALAALEESLQKNRPGLKLDSLAKPQLEALLKNLQAKADEIKGK